MQLTHTATVEFRIAVGKDGCAHIHKTLDEKKEIPVQKKSLVSLIIKVGGSDSSMKEPLFSSFCSNVHTLLILKCFSNN